MTTIATLPIESDALLPPAIAERLFKRQQADAAARQALVRRTPRIALGPEHTAGCEVLPDRDALLARLPAGAEVAEVGVADGDLSAEILRIVRPRRLHLIDLWEGPRYGPGLGHVSERFAAEIAAGRVLLHRGLSVDALEALDDASLDWLYIDTDHSYDTTIGELRVAQRKITPCGVIAGHDFCTGNPVKPNVYGVIQACHQFCVEAGFRYRYLTLDPSGFFSFALVRLAC